MSSATFDKRATEQRARRAMETRQYDEALVSLWQLASRANVTEDEFKNVVKDMASSYAALGRTRAAASARLYLGDKNGAFNASSMPLDRARVQVDAKDHAGAAQSFEDAGWLGHAAIQCEIVKNDRGARVLWDRLASDPRLSSDLYTAGLVHFNLGRACLRLGDRGAGRKAIVHAMHLLTAAADGFEAKGQRERAFDCYGVLLTIGKEGSFENLAEGYLNCIRILREDGLKYYVIQYYEDFQALAMQRNELHAAATLFREAADYSRRQGMPYARHYRFKGAEASMQQGERVLADGGSPEMAENAFAAAIDGFNELGLYGKVRALYGKLSTLELGDKRKARYERLAKRLEAMPDDPTPMQGFPDYLRMATAYPEIWILDVLEWEQGGDPAETMIDVALDRRWADFQRRRAMLVRLKQLGTSEGTPGVQTTTELAELLGSVELYVCLAPLEKMMSHEDLRVRAAAMKATRKLFFKRSFVSIAQGLADTAPEVRREALGCVQSLHFVHALDPLSRIYRESPEPEVRRAALASIGKVNRVEAVELLIEAFRNGDRQDKDVARENLLRSDQPDAREMLRREAAAESGPLRAELEHILRALGG
ncbi:MAG: HEAT repeat domain-containing protein [Deltaproteobacteria bacterium]|nr:HEAT repeat domain-containing protein [Deltaproteobacteria bacterium]